MAIVNPSLGDDVPENIKDLIEGLGLFVPPTLTEAEQEIYNRAVTGCCMTCAAELGENTMLVFNRAGIVMMFCGGACFSDQQVLGWLQETHDDLVDKIKFRGGQGDEP